MYLVDTNVLSAGAPGRRERSARLVEWMDARSHELFLSAVTVAEISDSIANLHRTGSAAKAARLGDWLELVPHLYGERVLPFDVPAARLVGEWMDAARPGRAHAGLCRHCDRGYRREPRSERPSRNMMLICLDLRYSLPTGGKTGNAGIQPTNKRSV